MQLQGLRTVKQKVVTTESTMMMRIRKLGPMVTFAAGLATCFCTPCFAQTKSISPDPKIQEAIRTVTAGKDNDETAEAIKQLQRLAMTKPDVLVPQLIHFGTKAKGDEAEGMLVVMAVLGPFSRLRQPMIPFLESDQETMRCLAREWLHIMDGRPQEVGSNYRAFLWQRKNMPPNGLVNYIFEQDGASKSLLFFAGIDNENSPPGWARPLLWSDHVISMVKWRAAYRFLEDGDLEKARKEMQKLLKDESWYVRRYVVEVLIEEPSLGSPEIVARLKNDAHPLVARRAKLIK